MSKPILVIYNLQILYDLLKEIKEIINFEILIYSEKEHLENLLKTKANYLIISNINLKNLNNINLKRDIKLPIKISELIENINISLLKSKYQNQSDLKIKEYILDINSRILIKNSKELKLTQKESEIILFLNNKKNGVTISNLQKEVWGHAFDLETHTVETHIYRLRKKINELFQDEELILNVKNGYKI